MIPSKFALLAPVIYLLLILKVEVKASTKAAINATTNAATKTGPITITIPSNVSTTHPSAKTTVHGYVGNGSPRFGPMLRRLVYVTLILSGVIGLYFLVKFCRSGRRKARKYGVVKTPGDTEMHPLESDDEDDDDVTMFNRKD